MAAPQPSWDRENHHFKTGKALCIGVDEVGRGPLAGPVVAAAVAVSPQLCDQMPEGVRDSKRLSAKRRVALSEVIRQRFPVALAWVSEREIDQLNILRAARRAMACAVEQLGCDEQTAVLVDGRDRINVLSDQEAIVKGDQVCFSIAAASIVAKVARDHYMAALGNRYPNYGFERHMGYGTALHIQAIEKHGLTSSHRRSFCTRFISISNSKNATPQKPKRDDRIERGRLAESEVRKHYEAGGYHCIGQNVRSPFGEIDLIVERSGPFGKEVRIVEVRSSRSWDEAMLAETVGPRKIDRLVKTARATLGGCHGAVDRQDIHFDLVVVTPVGLTAYADII